MFAKNSRCIASINVGYALTSGAEVRQCNGNGAWSGPTPECSKGVCARLPEPSNGVLICTGHDAGDTCHVVRLKHNWNELHVFLTLVVVLLF